MGTLTPNDTWSAGNAYELYMGRWSRPVARLFLEWLAVPQGLRWLDVGCGTGALSAAIVDTGAAAAITAVDPSAGFLAAAQAQLGSKVIFKLGSADDLPLAPASVDVTVSGLALNFVSNPRQALDEMVRVTRPGGLIAVYLWDYAARMEFIRYFWDVAVELDPAAAALDEAVRFPLCQADALQQLFASAGLHNIGNTALTVQTPFRTFDDFWQPFLGGQGPAPSYVMQLDEPARTRLHHALAARIPQQPDGSLRLAARAWAIRGTTF